MCTCPVPPQSEVVLAAAAAKINQGGEVWVEASKLVPEVTVDGDRAHPKTGSQAAMKEKQPWEAGFFQTAQVYVWWNHSKLKVKLANC